MNGIMNKPKYNNFSVGFILGLVFPAFGFIFYGLGWASFFNRSFSYFVNETFLGFSSNQSSIISLSLLANLIPFYFFLNSQRELSARGILGAVFIYVPVILYLRFF
jgi:hypothetical protein